MANPARAKGTDELASRTTNAVSSHLVGVVGEAHFIEFAAQNGWHIYRGFDGHTPCDFVVDTGEGLLRVEVKRVECLLKTGTTHYYHAVCKYDRKRFDFNVHLVAHRAVLDPRRRHRLGVPHPDDRPSQEADQI